MTNSKKKVIAKLNSIHLKIGVIQRERDPTMKPERHISRRFDNELKQATDLFLHMGEMVINQVTQAVHALVDSDIVLADKVIESDKIINQMERELDEMVMQLVIKRQPTANDFRLVMAMSKGVVDLERIGDEASKIARMSKELSEQGSFSLGYSEVQHLSNQVRLMTHETLEAFRNYDADQAFEVMRSDSVINHEYQIAMHALMIYLMENSLQVGKAMNIMWILRALERIGDHAKNIAELVIYTSSGQDVRHTDFSKVEKAVQEANLKATYFNDKKQR